MEISDKLTMLIIAVEFCKDVALFYLSKHINRKIMQKLLLLLAFLGSMQVLSAQCTPPQSQIDLHSNNIKARILGNGYLFNDGIDGQFIPNANPIDLSGPSTIYKAGIWIAAVDPAGNLKLNVADYSSAGGYAAGPLNGAGITDEFSCANWDRHFRVTAEEIAAFLAGPPATEAQAIAQYPGIMGWPARGNSTFINVWGFDLPANNFDLAGFVDANLNGLYEPLSGDYPAVQLQGKAPFVPAEIIWCVFNDQKGGASTNFTPLQVEIQLTAWSFQCPNENVLNNTVFTSHKIINRSAERMDSTYVGLWIDFDLGCYFDDYVGCNPASNSFFAYNQDALDGQPGTNCQGTLTFGDAPPVQSVTLLNRPISTFATYNNGGVGSSPQATTDPNSKAEYYNYLTGHWRDGTPFTYGGNGYGGSTPTDFLFPSDPADPNGWSMCSSNLPFDDRRVLASSKFGEVLPSQTEELTTAWSVHFNIPLPCSLGNTAAEVNALRNLFDNGFANLCSPVSKAPPAPADSLDLFPNPTTADATLRYGGIQVEQIRIFDAAGKMVQALENLGKESTELKLGQLPVGIYTLRIVTNQGNLTKKLAVVR